MVSAKFVTLAGLCALVCAAPIDDFDVPNTNLTVAPGNVTVVDANLTFDANENVPSPRYIPGVNWLDVDTCSLFESECCDESICDFTTKYGNSYCNYECNTHACGYDGGDCVPDSKQIRIVNECHLAIDVAIRYRKADGTWESKCWYNTEPFTAFNPRYVVSSNLVWYYYAEASSGNMVWTGDNEKMCGSRTLMFRKVTSPKNAEYLEATLTCNN